MRRFWRVLRVKPHTLGPWAGMNSRAARSVRFRFPSGKAVQPGTAVVDRSFSRPVQRKIIRHEVREDKRMGKGMPYWFAHMITTREDKQGRKR